VNARLFLSLQRNCRAATCAWSSHLVRVDIFWFGRFWLKRAPR
jgi:hypothetical protein